MGPSSRKSSREVDGRGREVGGLFDHPQSVLPLNWGGTETNRTVTCMVLKVTDNDRRARVTQPIAMMNFVGLDLAFADQRKSHKPQSFSNALSEFKYHTVKVGHDSSHSYEKAWQRTATAGSDVVQSGSPIFDDFFQHLWPYIGNNTANVVFQMVKRLWLISIDQ
ncbi:uncharacterized protein TNCV_2082801 [Trichonephila clavipes]|nr:uncharacterized protein TNCV_2082801 [Trichonephila clavipes]